MKEALSAIVRHALGAGGGYLVGKGLVDAATAQELIGGGMAMFAVLWSLWEKRKVAA